MAFPDNRIHLKIDHAGARSIDEYLEYRRIVGDDDGGTLFTPEQYEHYKKTVVAKRINNRLFVSWAAKASEIECIMVGPETKCFCQHRYKQHKTDLDEIPASRPIKIPCEVRGCGCKTYSYLPRNGSQPIRCTTCKHFSDEHSVIGGKKCKKSGCGCQKFYSAFTCGCGEPGFNHKIIVETKSERGKRGRPVGKDVPYKAMGGLTGFSSLAEGYMRLDSSGIGLPSKEFLEQPAGPHDHAFLKIHYSMKELSLEQPLRTEEDDMAYFERRYQERLKRENEMSRVRNSNRVKQIQAIDGKASESRSSKASTRR